MKMSCIKNKDGKLAWFPLRRWSLSPNFIV